MSAIAASAPTCARRSPSRIFALVLALLAGSVAVAGDVANVRVSASVLGVCKVIEVQEVQFGALDPSQPIDSDARGSVSFMCTRGVEYRLVADHGENFDASSGLRRMKAAGSQDFLPYALAREQFDGIGTGFRTPVVMPIDAHVNAEDYRDLPASSYSDVIRLVIEP